MPNTLAVSIQSRLDATIAHLQELARGSILRHYLKVGEYLLDTYFDGDAQLYGDNRRNKEAGFDALLGDRRAELAEMGLQPTTLRNSIRAFIVWRALPDATRSALDFTDLYSLAPVADLPAREKLANEAVQEGWSTRQVVDAVQQYQKAHKKPGARTGRPRLPVAFKQVAALVRAGEKLPTRASQLGALSAEQRVELRAGAVALRARLEVLAGLLDGLEGG